MKISIGYREMLFSQSDQEYRILIWIASPDYQRVDRSTLDHVCKAIGEDAEGAVTVDGAVINIRQATRERADQVRKIVRRLARGKPGFVIEDFNSHPLWRAVDWPRSDADKPE